MSRTRLSPDVRRDRILDAAIACFARSGPAVSTAKIARAAGVSEALIYHYFPTKDELWLAAVTRSGSFANQLRQLFTNLGASAEADAEVGGADGSAADAENRSIAAALGRVPEAFAGVAAEERQLIAILFGAALRDEPLGDRVRQGHVEATRRLGATLQAQSGMRQGVDPDTAMLGFLGGFVLFFIIHHRQEPGTWARRARAFAASWIQTWCGGAMAVGDDE